MKKVLFICLFLSCFLGQSQNTRGVNSYKYVVVPIKLDFLQEPDQYQTSSMSKFLFEKSGFDVYMSNEIFPDDLSKDRCLALTANIQRKSAFLSVKMYIELLDCKNNLVYKTEVYTSKYKEYKKAYRDVLRMVFQPIQGLNYKYQPVTSSRETKPIQKKEVVVKEKEVKPIKKETPPVDKKDVIAELTAKPIKNGFGLFDAKSELILEILKTRALDVFIIKGKNGTLYKSGDYWIAEYYDANNELVKKKYRIQF